jgi:hypothetical protein
MTYESLPIDASPATNLPELPNAPRSASASSSWQVPEHPGFGLLVGGHTEGEPTMRVGLWKVWPRR